MYPIIADPYRRRAQCYGAEGKLDEAISDLT